MSTLDERLALFSEPWRPQPGDTLIGTVVAIGERASQFNDGERYPVITVATDDAKEFVFHAYHTVARRELQTQQPQVGDRIGIAYHGRPDGKSYARYRICVERQQVAPVDWNSITATAAKEERSHDQEDDDIPF